MVGDQAGVHLDVSALWQALDQEPRRFGVALEGSEWWFGNLRYIRCIAL